MQKPKHRIVCAFIADGKVENTVTTDLTPEIHSLRRRLIRQRTKEVYGMSYTRAQFLATAEVMANTGEITFTITNEETV